MTAQPHTSISVAIVGGTGYGAGELLRLLADHPSARVASVVSRSMAGRAVAEAHPHLAGFYEGNFDGELDWEALGAADRGVIFCALPHGASARAIAAMHGEAGRRDVAIVDLSGDFRLSDEATRRQFYPEAADRGELQAEFVYGLSELNGAQIAGARRVANPGCLASACALAVAPLVDADFRGTIALDAKTGTSGAGATPQPRVHHPAQHANLTAYAALEHRHEPEIRQALGDAAGRRIATSFVPHLLPVSRGIYVTAFVELDEAVSGEDLLARYRAFYESAPFVRVREALPELRHVTGSNFCDVTVRTRGRQAVAMAALDNLIKGMAGQAIQNMNLMCGLDETAGLWRPAFGVI